MDNAEETLLRHYLSRIYLLNGIFDDEGFENWYTQRHISRDHDVAYKATLNAARIWVDSYLDGYRDGRGGSQGDMPPLCPHSHSRLSCWVPDGLCRRLPTIVNQLRAKEWLDQHPLID